MNSCPECGKQLPWGRSFRNSAGIGLPDKRTLDCPYCGHPLEPIRWTAFAGLAAILALAVASRKLIQPLVEPLLDWKTLAILVAVVVLHHIWVWRRWGRGE